MITQYFTFIFCLQSDFASQPYGCQPFQLHHKIEKKSTESPEMEQIGVMTCMQTSNYWCKQLVDDQIINYLEASIQTTSQIISTGAQYVTPDSKIYCEKVKMYRFSSGNWFFSTKFVQLAVAGKRRNTALHLQKRV